MRWRNERRLGRRTRQTPDVIARSAVTLIVFLALTSTGYAQAWVPPAGVGSVTLVYQTIDNTGHFLTDGSLLAGYDSESRALLLDVDYALSDRISVSASLPYVAAKYTGPLGSFSALPIDECHCWNRGWQDFGFTGRYNVINGRFALTPSVSFNMPSHDYSYFGEAVLGRNLKEFRIAVAAGQRLDAVSQRLSLQARYSYALVEKVLDLPNNRSNMAIESAFSFTRNFGTRAVFAWQRSHGGLRGDTAFTQEQFEQFDRLLRDNSFHAGGGVSYSLPRVDLFASYIAFATGTDTHAGRAITAGISWPFQLR
jgi:hypothetical protein